MIWEKANKRHRAGGVAQFYHDAEYIVIGFQGLIGGMVVMLMHRTSCLCPNKRLIFLVKKTSLLLGHQHPRTPWGQAHSLAWDLNVACLCRNKRLVFLAKKINLLLHGVRPIFPQGTALWGCLCPNKRLIFLVKKTSLLWGLNHPRTRPLSRMGPECGVFVSQ